jgi:predicted secreted protein
VLLAAVAGCGQSQKSGSRNGAESKDAAGSRGPGRSSATGAAKGSGERRSSSSSGQPSASKSEGAGGAKSASGRSAGGWYLTEKDNGKHLELHPGDLILVKVGASRSNGYQWLLRDSGSGVVRREGDPVFTPAATEKGKSTDTGTEAWRFRAVKPGEQTIKLEYLPPWSKTVPERTLRFTVSVR